MKYPRNLIMCCGLTAIVALSFSCERETECTHPTTRYQITDADISLVPYTSNSKLVFVRRSTNDSFEFHTEGWGGQIKSTQTQEDCYRNLEFGHRFMTLKSNSTNEKIVVSILYYDESVPFLEIQFKNTVYSTSLANLASPFDYDSLQIQGYYHHNVEAFAHMHDDGINDEYSCFFNSSKGILKMETSDGDTWELRKLF
jgi:hypothetical protein